MKRFVEGVDREQITLFPAVLDDYVGEDNPVRAIDVGPADQPADPPHPPILLGPRSHSKTFEARAKLFIGNRMFEQLRNSHGSPGELA